MIDFGLQTLAQSSVKCTLAVIMTLITAFSCMGSISYAAETETMEDPVVKPADRLATEESKIVYNLLKEKIEAVAAGTLGANKYAEAAAIIQRFMENIAK